MTEIPWHLRMRAEEARLRQRTLDPVYYGVRGEPRTMYTQAQLDDAVTEAAAAARLEERAAAAASAPKIGSFSADVVSAVLAELDQVVDEKVQAGRENLAEFAVDRTSAMHLGLGWLAVWFLCGVSVVVAVGSVTSVWLGALAGAWTLADLWAIGKWSEWRALNRAIAWTKIEITRRATGVDDVVE